MVKNEKKYFEFSLANGFFKNIVPGNFEEFFKDKVIQQLYEFTRSEIVDSESKVEKHYCIFRLSTTNQNDVKNAENFLKYLMQNNILLNLVKRNMIGLEISDKDFQKELKNYYTSFNLYEHLSEEIDIKNEISFKRPKI
jgi:hypothetical protein